MARSAGLGRGPPLESVTLVLVKLPLRPQDLKSKGPAILPPSVGLTGHSLGPCPYTDLVVIPLSPISTKSFTLNNVSMRFLV